MNRILIAAAALAVAACGAPAKVIHVPDGPLAAGGDTITRPPSAPKGAPAPSFGGGTHRVLTDVQPGVYRTGGSTLAGIPLCSWKLTAGGHLVASGSATGPVAIVVEPEYATVESAGCLDWQRVGDAP